MQVAVLLILLVSVLVLSVTVLIISHLSRTVVYATKRTEIRPEDVIVLHSTRHSNKTSNMRAAHLRKTLPDCEIVVLEGVFDGSPLWRAYKHLRNLIVHFIEERTEPYGLICDDDMSVRHNFWIELNLTLNDLPENWEVLHLCIGCLWGRNWSLKHNKNKSNEEKKFVLHPEKDHLNKLNLYETTPLQRAVHVSNTHCPYGGPLAMLLRREHAVEFLRLYDLQYEIAPEPNDVIVKQLNVSKTHFASWNPPLCIENDQGSGPNDWRGT